MGAEASTQAAADKKKKGEKRSGSSKRHRSKGEKSKSPEQVRFHESPAQGARHSSQDAVFIPHAASGRGPEPQPQPVSYGGRQPFAASSEGRGIFGGSGCSGGGGGGSRTAAEPRESVPISGGALPVSREETAGAGEAVAGSAFGVADDDDDTTDPDPASSKGFLQVRITAAHNLVNKDSGLFGDVSDPYVVARVGRKAHTTPCINDCLDPVWESDNEFSFVVGSEAGSLRLEVFNSNIVRDDTLGWVTVPLWSLAPNQWCKRRESLEGVAHGELSFEVHFGLGAGGAQRSPAAAARARVHYPFGHRVEQPEEYALPLRGVRVLEITRRLWSSALCGRMLATCGADVIRVAFGDELVLAERRTGDKATSGRRSRTASRGRFPSSGTAKFGSEPADDERRCVENPRANEVPAKLHAGKRLAPHNLLDQQDLALLHNEVLPGCDVLLTDLPTDELDKLFLSYNRVHKRLPHLIYVHASAIGSSADLVQKGVEDMGAFYCLAGFAEEMGHTLGPAGFVAATSASALFGIVSLAVMRRRCGNQGDRVDFSIFRSGRWCGALGAMTKWAKPPRPPSASSQHQAVAHPAPPLPFQVLDSGCLAPPGSGKAVSAALEPLHLRWKAVASAARTPPVQQDSQISSELPLARVSVIEMSDEYQVSAAAIGALLADLGARVTKIERPQRPDPWKKICKGFYEELNSKKLVQAMDYTAVGSQAALYRTLADTTMFVTNLPMQALETWGLAIPRLRHLFPHLIIVLVTTWGCDGSARQRETEVAQGPGQEVQAFWEASGLSSKCFNNLGMPPGLSELAVSLHALGGVGLALLRQQRVGTGQLVHVSRHGAGLFSCNIAIEAPRSPLCSPLLPVKEGRFLRILGRGHHPHDAWLLAQALGLRPSLWEKFGGDASRIQRHLAALEPDDLRSMREELANSAKRLSFDELAGKLSSFGIDWFAEEVRPVNAEELHKERCRRLEDLKEAHQDAVESALLHAEGVASEDDELEDLRHREDQNLRHAWEREASARDRLQQLQMQFQSGIPPDIFVETMRAEGLRSAIKGDMPSTYCVCQVPLNAASRVQTAIEHETASPEWHLGGHELVHEYALGDRLLFAVFARDRDEIEDDVSPSDGRSGEVHVTVCAAYNLKNLDTGIMGDMSDPYVIVSVGGEEQRTPTINDNLNPKWTEKNDFRFRISEQDAFVKFKVMNHNYMTDDSLGWHDLDIRMLRPEERQLFKVPLMNGDGAELEIDCFVKPPHPCAPHHEEDALIGQAILEAPQFYPSGCTEELPLFLNDQPTGGMLHVGVVVEPRDLARSPLPTLGAGTPSPMPGQQSNQTFLPPGSVPQAGMSPGSAQGSQMGGPGWPSPSGVLSSQMGGPGGAPPAEGWQSQGAMPAAQTPGLSPGASQNPMMSTISGMLSMLSPGATSQQNGQPMGSIPPLPPGPSGGPQSGLLPIGPGGPMASSLQSRSSSKQRPPTGSPVPQASGQTLPPQAWGSSASPGGRSSQFGGDPAWASGWAAPQLQQQLPPPDFSVPVSVLHVRINQASGLKNKDSGLFGDYSDPYVLVQLGSLEYKTPVVDNNLDPVWDRDNYFTLEVQMQETLLKFTVLNKNKFVKDDVLGGAEVDLRTLARGEWCRFKERLVDGAGAELGFDLYCRPTEFHSLKWDVTSKLYVVINGADSLINKDTGILGDVSDPYVVVKVGNSEKKTPTIDDNLNPRWEEGNHFFLAVEDADAEISIEVMNSNMRKDDSLGHVSIALHQLQPDTWCSFLEKLVDGDRGKIQFQAFWKPAEVHRRQNNTKQRGKSQAALNTKAADLAHDIKDAEFSMEWLEDIGGRSQLPLSVEERDWEHACGGRNFVIPGWVVVTQTQVAAVEKFRQKKPHVVSLFPDEGTQTSVVKAKVKIISAEGLFSTILGDRPNAYCICEIPRKESSQVKTPFAPGSANPVWRHSRTVKDYSPGDALLFSVFSMGSDSMEDAADGGRRRGGPACKHELLGSSSLPGSRFYPDGFDGLLNLSLAGRPTEAALRVTAFVQETH